MKWLRRTAWILAGLLVLGVGIRLALPAIGRFHVRSDELKKADLIVVLSGTRIERTLEGGVLYREGWGPQVFLTRTPDIANWPELKRMNVRIPLMVESQRDVLKQMGVPEAAVIFSDGEAGTTRQEAEVVSEYCRRMKLKRIIVITSPYHTARSGRYFRAAAGGSVEVLMRPTRYEPYDTNDWWRRPPDRVNIVLEYMKVIHGLLPGTAALHSCG